MGIDIHAHWLGQTASEKRKQRSMWLSAEAGATGYLREAYHGAPYATMHLCAEAFHARHAVVISAAVLRERLAKALEMVEERYHSVYHATPDVIRRAQQSFRDFVALCEAKERETGDPVSIVASY